MSSGMPPPFTFGPVPSRRLGQSLGVNNIPPKHCSYACMYCQLGRTPNMTVERQTFFQPEAIADAVQSRLVECGRAGTAVDYLTLVPDGEPTLDVNLGRLLTMLRGLGPPLAVITNGSLMDRAKVRSELAIADWVSVKVDAVDTKTWRLVDRPHGQLRLENILEGLQVFSQAFRSTLVTETMLVSGVNDSEAALDALATSVSGIAPAVAYLAVPVRPPAESSVRPPGTDVLVRAYEAFSRLLPRVELLVGEPPEAVAPSSDVERDLLAITAVHPLDEGAVVELGGGSSQALEVAEDLTACGQLEAVVYGGRRFFVRSFTHSRDQLAGYPPRRRGVTASG